MRMIALTIALSAVLCFGGCGQNGNSESATKQESTTSAETSKKSSETGKNTTKKKTTKTSKKVSETKADSTKDNKKTDTKSEAAKNETSKKVTDNKNNSSNKNTGNSNNNNGNGTKPSSNSTNANPSKPADNSGNQNVAKPSNNSLNTNNTGNSSGINNGETPETAKKEETVHNHDWIKQTHEIHHDATGHYEDVIVQEAWDEPIIETSYRVICNGCGADITNYITEHTESQMLAGNFACGAYTTGVPVDTVVGYNHHDAVTESQWVEDSPAYNETVVDGYKCSSCGATIQ